MNRRALGGAAVGGAVLAALTSAPAQAAETAVVAARTVTGPSVSTPFGPVQVKVKVRNGRIAKVTAIAYPRNDRKSQQINAYAIPALQRQAVAAQSAAIDGVSGASWTTRAFTSSLQSALTTAGFTSRSA